MLFRSEKGTSHTFKMFMAEPFGGWVRDGKLRIESENLLDESKWAVKFNGVTLASNSDVSEPYPDLNRNLLGLDQQYRAFTVPFGAVKNGDNDIEVTMIDGDKSYDISFMDIALQ